MRPLLLFLAPSLVAGCDQSSTEKPANAVSETAATSAQVDESGRGVDRSHAGSSLPDLIIKNPDGGDTNMKAMAGVPTLVNLWASWCAPCVKELPTLDALAERHLVDGQLGVLAVSQDTAPKESVEAFLKSHKIKHLGAFRDPDMKLSGKLGAVTLPTTVLYDAQGKEVWRFVGDMDWTSAEAAKLLAEAAKPAAG